MGSSLRICANRSLRGSSLIRFRLDLGKIFQKSNIVNWIHQWQAGIDISSYHIQRHQLLFNRVVIIVYQLDYQQKLSILLQQQITMNLSKSYHQIFPSRINPEFIGVSSIYSEHKNHRKTEQSKKQSLQSSRLYIQNLDRNLQKTIYSKSVELNRLQSSRDRRLQQAKNKSQRDQMRKNEIDKLKQMNNKRRQELKKKLQKSRSQLYTQNRQGWRQLKSSLSQNHQIKNENLMQQLTINIHKKLSVKQGQSAAIDKINTFHRRKNTENLQAYMRRIKLQNRLKRLNQDKSKKLKLDVNRLNKTIYLKKNYLLCLQSEIGKFKTDIYSFNKTQLSRAKKNQQQQQQAKMYTNKSFQKFYKKETHK